MKILWTVNTFDPSIAKMFSLQSSHAISWVEAMSNYLKDVDKVELAIAAPCRNEIIQNRLIDGISYFATPNNLASWKKVIDTFQPDIIHAYGTEKAHNLYVLEAASDIPVLVSLQGLLSEYEKHYYGGIDFSVMLRYTPIRDLLRPSGFFTGRRDFRKRSTVEKEILSSVKYVEGRSTWDRVSSCNINPNLKYFYCPRMLRKAFNESEQWSLQEIERHSILVSQGNYPIKGLHFAFFALAKLKERYPDVKLYITGHNMLDGKGKLSRFLWTGYKRYLFDLADSLGIMDNIYFTGHVDADGMVKLLRRVHVALIPSVIENAPNSLAEAMMVGTPCVASFVGGNMDMLKHGEEGFLYCYNEPNMLAEYIDSIFSSDDLATSFSEKSRLTAQGRHSQVKLVDHLLQIYDKIIEDK